MSQKSEKLVSTSLHFIDYRYDFGQVMTLGFSFVNSVKDQRSWDVTII